MSTQLTEADALAAMRAQMRGREPRQSRTVRNPTRSIGRNDPCPCGSGRKFKACCLHKVDAPQVTVTAEVQ